MSRFDLNSPVDFAALTVSSTAALLQDFLGKNPNDWDIVEGSYKANDPSNPKSQPVLFHIFKSQSVYQAGLSRMSDRGGLRKAKYVFPYVNGQTTEHMGRKAQDFSVDVLLHGNNYKTGLSALMNEVLKPFPGILQHPVMGSITCVLEDYEIIHAPESNKAAAVHLSFTEHNFSIDQFADPKVVGNVTTTSALSQALSFLGKVSTMITAVTGVQAFAKSLQIQITNTINAYQTQFGTTLTNINVAFNGSNAASLPSAFPVQQGGNNGSTNSTFSTAASPSDPFQNLPVSQQIPTTVLTTVQAINQVNALRDQANSLIQLIESGANGLGSLLLYDQVQVIKQSAIDMQNALEVSIANSQATISNYVTPRVMSLREVAFANQLSPDRMIDIMVLNGALILSTNFIDQGVTIQVPTS